MQVHYIDYYKMWKNVYFNILILGAKDTDKYRKTQMKGIAVKCRGFTLIELLVVIAIIALLMAVIIPSLKAAKELASGAVCVAHQRQLCLAWISYTEDYDYYIVGGSNYTETPYRWVEYPMNDDGTWSSTAEYSLKTRQNGIRAGRLFPYTQNEDLYHCSGDKKYVKNVEPDASFRSYSITGLMNGEDFDSKDPDGTFNYRTAVTSPNGQSKELRLVTKISEISSPGDKHVFVEEDCGDQQVNAGSFVLLYGTNYDWWDVPADYHNGSSTTGFADGHAERRRWQDEDTIKLIKGEIGSDPEPTQNEDLHWLVKGYIPRQ